MATKKIQAMLKHQSRPNYSSF